MKVRILNAAVVTIVVATIATAASADAASSKTFHNRRGGETKVTRDRGQNGIVTNKHITTRSGRTIDTRVAKRVLRPRANNGRSGRGPFSVHQKTRTVTRPDGRKMVDVHKKVARPGITKRSHTRIVDGKTVTKQSTVRHRKHMPMGTVKHGRYGRMR